MTLKHILYTSTAALAMVAPTLVTGVVANAATGTPAQTTAQAGKANDNKQTSDENANPTSVKATNSQAAKTNDNKATNNKAASSAPAKTSQTAASDHASANNDVKATPAANNNATPAKTDATQSLSKVDFGAFKTSTPTKVAQDYNHKAPRYTGSSYTNANQGYSTSVTATNDNSTLNYAVSNYNSDGSASSQPFAIKIYKNGSLYKTFKSNTGAAKGSLNVDKGTYSLKVLTSASAHYTGGLSLS